MLNDMNLEPTKEQAESQSKTELRQVNDRNKSLVIQARIDRDFADLIDKTLPRTGAKTRSQFARMAMADMLAKFGAY